jgi:hypothetical protein
MIRSPFSETDIHRASKKTALPFMIHKGSLACSERSKTARYPEDKLDY